MFFKNIKLYNYKNIGKNQSKPCNHSYCIRTTGRFSVQDVTEYQLAYPDLA